MARRITQESTDQLQALMRQRYRLPRSILITSNRIIDEGGFWAASGANFICQGKTNSTGVVVVD